MNTLRSERIRTGGSSRFALPRVRRRRCAPLLRMVFAAWLLPAAATAQQSDWVAEANERIAELRQRELVVTVFDADGEPVPAAQVRVEQVRRAFPFGMAVNINAFRDHPEYRRYIEERFTWAVHENAAKWYANEGSEGNVTYAAADEVLAWADERGITMRGHTIFWAPERWQPNWVQGLTGEPLRTAVENRLESAVTHFQGRLAHWDVNNEMLHGSFFADRLGADIRDWMFTRTRELDPDVKLFLNDYNVLSWTETEAYAAQLQGFLDRGVPVDGIGMQGHFRSVDPLAVQERLDRMGEFGLPLWITELDVLEADVEVRADALEAVLRMAYSHPAVEGILLWGFWEGNHWRGPDAALVNLDWSLNPAGERLDALLAEWTSDETLAADNDGRAAARVFHGDYEVTVTAGEWRSTHGISVMAGSGPRHVDIVLRDPFEGEAVLLRSLETDAGGDPIFAEAAAVAEHADGRWLVALPERGRVVACDRDGNCEDFSAGGMTPAWCAPVDLDTDFEGNVWVLDSCGEDRVHWCPAGDACRTVPDGGLLDTPSSIAAAGAGRAVVGDAGNGRVLDCDGAGCGLALDTWNEVLDVAADEQGRLLVIHDGQLGHKLSLCDGEDCRVISEKRAYSVTTDAFNRILVLTDSDPLESPAFNAMTICDHTGRCDYPLYSGGISGLDAPGQIAVTRENHVLASRYRSNGLNLYDIPEPEPLNPGFNDAWFNPDTAGQGFFLNVFPDDGNLFLAWFTYDTQRPDGGVEATLGDPGHRWLTAFGPLRDNRAELTVSTTAGGLFDSTTPVPASDASGRLQVQFDGCDRGTVSYRLDGVNATWTVMPIERVVPDNQALCEALARTPSD